MHDLDAYWAKQVPVLPVPAYATLDPLTAAGHRILVARNGTFAEVRRPWLHALICMGNNNGFALPFGVLREQVALAQPIPRKFLSQFTERAHAAFPNETAAWLVWHETQGYRLMPLVESDAGLGHVRFERPALGDSEHLVLDLHSHGACPAFFSPTDDQDDRGEVKLAAVVGNLGTDRPNWVLRLCLLGILMPLPDQHTLFTE